MNENRNAIVAVAILITLAGVLLSCCAGAAGGMVAASLQADRFARRLDRPPEPTLTPRSTGQSGVTPREMEPLAPEPSGTRAAPEGWDASKYAGGAVVLEVRTDGPALASGLQRDDVIVFVGDTAVTPGITLAALIAEHRPGDRVTIRYWRADQERTTSIELEKSPLDPDRAYLGVTTVPVTPGPTPTATGSD